MAAGRLVWRTHSDAIAREWGRNLRRRRGPVRQKQLSAMSGVPQHTISRVERGAFLPSLDTLLKLCAGLGAEPAEMFPWPTLRDAVERIAAS